MKRTRLSMVLTLALVLFAALSALAGCGGSKNTSTDTTKKTEATKPAVEPKKEKPSLTLRLAENQSADYPTTLGDLDFAKRVSEKTNGRIKIDVYHGAQLGDEKTVIEQIQLGAIDFARVNVQPMGEFSKKIGVLNLPYLFDNENHLWKVLNGAIGQELLDSLAGSKMVGLTFYDSGSRSFYNSKREAKVPADLKGLKIRVQQSALMVDLVNALGASATPMAYGEVYNGLKTGVIEGAENNWPSYFSTSHYEVAKFITLDHHTRSPEVVIASQALWDKLDAEDRQVIVEAAKASTETQRQAWKAFEKTSIDKVKAAGNTITEVTDLKAWQDAVAPLYDTHGANFKDMITKIKAAK